MELTESTNNDYLKYMLEYFKLNGMWPLRQPETKLFARISKILFGSVFASILFTLIGIIFHFLFKAASLNDIVFDVINFCLQLMGLIQATYLKLHQREMNELFATVNFKYLYSIDTEFQVFTMDRALKHVKMWSLLWGSVGIIAMQPSHLEAVWAKILPIAVWYPFIDMNSRFVHIMLFAIQVYSQTQMAISFCNTDNIAVCLLILTREQFSMLNEQIKSLHYRVLLKIGNISKEKVMEVQRKVEKDICKSKLQDILSQVEYFESMIEPTKEMIYMGVKDELLRLIAYHQTLLDCCVQLDAFVSPILFCKFCFASIFLCICPFYAYSQVQKHNWGVIQMMLQLTMLDTIEMSIVCYFGHLVTMESSKVRETVFDTPWHIFYNADYDELMRMIIVRTNSPVVITAGKFYELSLITLKNVLSAAFSYFTFMRRIEN